MAVMELVPGESLERTIAARRRDWRGSLTFLDGSLAVRRV
jgi:hypothetical protein